MTEITDRNTALPAERTGRAIVQINASYPNFMIYGGLKEGSPPIKLMALLRRFIPDIPGTGDPETDDRLLITTLNFSADTLNKSYAFEGEVENVWSIPLGFGTPEVKLEIESLYLFLQRMGREFGVLITGELALFETTFIIRAERALGTRFWKFSGALAESETIILGEIVKQVAGESVNLEESDLTRSLNTFQVSNLGVEIDTSPSKRYAFRGAMDWQINFSTGEQLLVSARVDIRSTLPPTGTPTALAKKRLYTGEIGGEVSFKDTDTIEFFQNLSLAVAYQFTQEIRNTQLVTTKELKFKLIIDQIELIARYVSKPAAPPQPAQSLLIISFGNTTFGNILNFLVGLVDPGIGAFELDPPWNELTSLSLQGMELVIDLKQKEVTFLYPISGGLNLGFVNIQKIGLTYTRVKGPGGVPTAKRTVEVEIIGRIGDKTYTETSPKTWDTLNDPPPAVPGQGSAIFDLRFLGVGQHVAFKDVRDFPNITTVMNALKGVPGQPGAIVPVPNKTQHPLEVAQLLQFDSKSGWLIGAQFSVIGTLDISIIFNDPLIYGVRIGLAGAKAKIFAGLVFEILYRRISDTVGVYHIELVLPDAMRQLEFGAVSVTLPVIVVDIYTNGDFKLDFGFPWKFNFARSFAVDAFPFTGAGGFYFNKLSAETATSVPIITNGRFNPVIEFGIGLKIGLGKTFNKGVLKAELSITVQGLLEGVFAWFNPTNPNQATDLYYRIQGGVAIVGRLWGLVDFEVIQVEVEVIVRVAVVFVVEAYQPILITLTAEVSVRASIKIVFVRIHFSFNLTITQKFTLGSARPTPWILNPDQSKRRPVTGTGTQFMAPASAPPFAPETAQPLMAERFAAMEAIAVDAIAIDSPLDTQPDVIDLVAVESVEVVAAVDVIVPETDAIAPPISLETRVAAFNFTAIAAATPLSWQAIAVTIPILTRQSNNRYPLDLFFQPAVTLDHVGVQGIGLLLIENAIDVNSSSAASFAHDAARTNRDFDGLLQGLLIWAIDAYYVQAGTGTVTGSRAVTPDTYAAIALAELESLYAMFVQGEQDEAAPFTFAQLMAFLQRNFVFNVTTLTEATSGTLFPMLPQLRMQPGVAAEINFNDAQYQLDAGDRREFARYFEQLKGHHGSTVERPTSSANGSTSAIANAADSLSVATFVFVDYFGVLVRSLIQSAIEYTSDYLKQHPERTTIPLTTLLEGLNKGGQFNHIAAMASRFLLHGLRLPDWDDALVESVRNSPDRPTIPLYKAIGQQFPLAGTVDSTFTIRLRKPDDPTDVDQGRWITLQDSYPLSAELVTLIQQLGQLRGTVIQFANPTPLPLYSDQPRRFNIRQSTDWRAQFSSTQRSPLTYTLLDLPDDLRDFQATNYLPIRQANRTNPPTSQQIDPGITLALKQGQLPTKPGAAPGRTVFDRTELRPEDIHPVTDGFWATRVTVSVRRVPSLDGTALLERTYLLVGTDEEGKDLLEDLWQHLRLSQPPHPRLTAKLYLLHADNGRDGDGERVPALVNPIPVETLLLKTNLSTYSTRPVNLDSTRQNSLYSATLSDSAAFIQLLWEGSTVNTGGYYLRLAVDVVENGQTTRQGLPNHLFADGLTASLVLLVELSTSDDRTLPLYHFQNCLVVRRELDLRDSVLYAESTRTTDVVKALTIPPGNIGFQQTRLIPLLRNDASGREELESLYQLLGYRLIDPDNASNFTASNEGLPIGPTESSQPKTVTIAASDTLQTIATGLIVTARRTPEEIARSRQDKLIQLAETNADKPDVFRVGVQIPFNPTSTYTTQAGDSFASIASATQRSIADVVLAAQALPNALLAGTVLQGTQDLDEWNYERVLPIYGLAKRRHAPDTATLPERLRSLPAAARDPYAGISATAQVTLEFHWQDVYGNRLTRNGVQQLSTDVRYFDRLLGINQWSSVAESYQFRPLASDSRQVELIIELVFDQSPFIPAPGRPFSQTQEKTRTARATYEQAYYQIHQPDVAFTVHTSVLRDSTQPQQPQKKQLSDRQKKHFSDFVESAYLYLSTLERLQAQTHAVQTGTTLDSISGLYYVTVAAFAAANADTPQLFATNQSLALAYAIAPDDTLNRIANALVIIDGASENLPAQVTAKLDQLAQTNADTPGLLAAGAVIPLSGGTVYTVQSNDTLTTIAQTTQQTVQQIVQAAKEVEDLLQPKALLRVNYSIQSTDSLRSLEQKAQAISPHLNLTLAEIAEQNRTVALRTGLSLVVPERVTIARGLPSTTSIPEGATLATITAGLLANRNTDGELGSFSAADVAIANQSMIGLLSPGVSVLRRDVTKETLNRTSSPSLNETDWQQIITANITTRINETFHTLAIQFAQVLTQAGKSNPLVTVADVASAIAHTPNLLVAGQTLIVPPASLIYTANTATTSHLSVPFDRLDSNNTLLYLADQFILPVTVQIDMTRNQDLVINDAAIRQAVPEIQTITAFLSPKTTPLSAATTGSSEQINSLNQFATDFQNAFPNLHLAVGNELPHKHSTAASDDTLVFRPLWAVHIGPKGIQYDIQESMPFFFTPTPLSNTLLAGSAQINTYQSGTGLGTKEAKQVESIDLNVLARDFLAAVEDFLEPAVSVPAALRNKSDKVTEILRYKETLADAIHTQVNNILAQTDTADITRRRAIAANALRQQLLVNLVEAFDIETIIQYNVNVNVAGIDPRDSTWQQSHPNWTRDRAPRLSGQPVVLNLQQINEDGSVTILDPNQLNSAANFTLSAAKIPLSPEDSYLTFFFDTKSPEKLENLRLGLVYRVSELEYDITPVEGISDYQASSWLTFILPIASTAPDRCDPKTEPNCIGDVDIPIPLRTYPIPPSLVLHRAEADRDSLETLNQIREWQYTFVYEHLDVAQDAIASRIEYNVAPVTANGSANGSANAQASASTNVSPTQQELFSKLVNFASVYPQILPTLKELANEQTQVSATVINKAIDDFTTLVGEVAIAWKNWRKGAAQSPAQPRLADYTIDEFITDQTKQMKIQRRDARFAFPTVFVPRYQLESEPSPTSRALTGIYRFREKTDAEANLDPVFGESSIPDRVLSLPNLDIIKQQNAWAAVWLTRNQRLVRKRNADDGTPSNEFMDTNPAFVFQTPEVRFSNLITPLLVNRQRWDIATIDAPDGKTPQSHTLAGHLEKLFATLLPSLPQPPEPPLKAYDLRVACRYAFALSAAAGINQDLLSTLPVLLSPRFPVAANQNPLTATATLRTNLTTDIKQWFTTSKPNATNALFIFSVSLFSNPSEASAGDTVNLPLLQIEHLGLRLEQIADLR